MFYIELTKVYVVLTGGPYMRTCPGSGKLCEPNHKPDAEHNNINIPAASKSSKLSITKGHLSATECK